MFKPMLFATIVAGVLAGLLFAATQQILTVPLIMEAELYEDSALALLNEETDGDFLAVESSQENNVNATGDAVTTEVVTNKDTANEEIAPVADMDAAVSKRMLYTGLGSLLTSLVFALLMTAAMTVYGKGNARTGLLWGLAGYLAFFVAPSLGLAPKLPSAVTTALEHRQLWWGTTVLATLFALALLMLAKPILLKVVGVLLLAIPHWVGAPVSEQATSLAPEALSHAFIWMTAVTNFVLWITLGVLIGWLLKKFQVIHGRVWD